jgi:uncharacterized protein YrrD
VPVPAIDSLRHGAPVFSSGGARVGTLHAIIVDPRSNQVTHLGVNAGPHFPEPGFGDPKIVSVDISLLRDATDDRVDLDLAEARFRDLPLYEHTHFFRVPDEERQPETAGLPARLWEAGLAVAASLASLGTGITVPAEHFAKASFERHILNDAPVWREEPSLQLGEVEEVLIDGSTDEIAGLVIREGDVFSEKVVLPIRYVTEIRDGLIHVQITDEEIEQLEPHRG